MGRILCGEERGDKKCWGREWGLWRRRRRRRRRRELVVRVCVFLSVCLSMIVCAHIHISLHSSASLPSFSPSLPPFIYP